MNRTCLLVAVVGDGDLASLNQLAGASPTADRPRFRFAVQKHQARSLHYDFRLEIDAVLVSWAVPRGPSKDPKVRRLAVRVPDHPLDYLLFEGDLPEGEYGAGDVIVWDHGEYELVGPERYAAAEALRDGTLRFVLYGTKLRGQWALFRTRLEGGGRENWLLEKLRDAFVVPGYDPEHEPNSVISGRALRARAGRAVVSQQSPAQRGPF